MIVPDIKTANHLLDFLSDLYSVNKQVNPAFSIRFVASRLNWSISCTHDAFNGRLSMKKAGELMLFLKLDREQATRFTILYFAFSQPPQVAECLGLLRPSPERMLKSQSEEP